jgi:3-oxoacyl-[acyl-carrier-protein] synthase-3
MSRVDGVALRAMAAAVPCTVARTSDYESMTVEERARFEKATGIGARRISPATQCASDLCAAAVERIFEHLGWTPDSVGAIVLITQSPDYPLPATAIVLQDKLKLPQSCLAFDVNLGCSSFPYGMAIVASLMKTLAVKRALLLIGDISSRGCSVDDKATWPLFGDAGTATALELDDTAAPMFLDLMSDGSGKDAIILPYGGKTSRMPAGDHPGEKVVGPDGIARRRDSLVLRGADVFSFAISKVPPSIHRVLEESGHGAADTDILALHQANKMINDVIAKKTGFPPEKAISTLSDYGNTSSASIPLTICAHAARFDQPRQLAACGFGVGLSWGTCVMTVPANTILPVVETDAVY